jgi:hypothetical protein
MTTLADVQPGQRFTLRGNWVWELHPNQSNLQPGNRRIRHISGSPMLTLLQDREVTIVSKEE